MNTNMNYTIEYILRKAGIYPEYSGYTLIVSAVQMIHNEPDVCDAFSTYVYRKLGKKFNKSITAVEASIRHAIERAYKNEREKLKFFMERSLTRRPSNKELICYVNYCLDSAYMQQKLGIYESETKDSANLFTPV